MIGRRRLRAGLLAAVAAASVSVACGKKGPPLPPLVLLPVAPGEFAAVRRGERVEFTLRIPNANTDRSTPADLARVEIYAWTVPGPVSADEVVRRGTRVGSIAVNKPKDPDEPEPKIPEPKGAGVDQNAVATFSDTLPPDAVATGYRAYVAVGVNLRGRPGALSARLAVPLIASPPPPSQLQLKYDEKAITVSWPVVPPAGGAPAYAYSVYRPGSPAALTPAPVAVPQFLDNAIEWEQERCYEVRTVATVENVRIESPSSPSRCVTLHDTFAPAKPDGLVGVGSEGAVSLIWTANLEADLAGYIVLRAVAPATALTPVTPVPIPDTNFRDVVQGGSRVTYAVQAVDKAGNRSEPSATITETAR